MLHRTYIRSFYRKTSFFGTVVYVTHSFLSVFCRKQSSKFGYFYIGKGGEIALQKCWKLCNADWYTVRSMLFCARTPWRESRLLDDFKKKRIFCCFCVCLSRLYRHILQKNDRKIWSFLYRQRRRKNLSKNVKNFVT